VFAVAVLLASFVSGLLPAQAVLAQADGGSYESDEHGYTVEWESTFWVIDDERSSVDGDADSLILFRWGSVANVNDPSTSSSTCSVPANCWTIDGGSGALGRFTLVTPLDEIEDQITALEEILETVEV
jgi:hypothetical protein